MKRRILTTGLVLFALWPLAHYALVESYGTDPWKLFGWAMYCVPGPMKTVRVVELRGDGSFRVLDFNGYTPEEQVAVDTFRMRRRALGKLQSPDELARRMLELNPDFEGVEIAVVSLVLSRESAMTWARLDRRTYWRDGRDEPFEFSPAASGIGDPPS